MNIKQLPGMVVKKDGTISDVLTLLGLSASEMPYVNDGRGCVISSFEINGKQYALSDVLTMIGNAVANANYGLDVEISGAGTSGDPYKTSHTFAEMIAASPLNITWNGNPAAEVTYTKSGSTITAVVVKFLTFSTTLTVTTFTINSSGITKAEKEYTLTEET